MSRAARSPRAPIGPGAAKPRSPARSPLPRIRTTIPAKDGDRAKDLLNRDFTAPAPNLKWVTDFTWVRAWAGWVYVAFKVDVFAQKIVAWHAATTKTSTWVEWYNHSRLHGTLGLVTPVEYEQAHYAALSPVGSIT